MNPLVATITKRLEYPVKTGKQQIKDPQLFRSRTRLFTNFRSGEHKEAYVIESAKGTLSELTETFPKLLTEDSFVEGVLAGGNFKDLEVKTTKVVRRNVDISLLKGQFVRWLSKMHTTPRIYFKRMSMLFDEDGYLCIDIEMAVRIPPYVLDLKSVLDTPEKCNTEINAVHNILASTRCDLIRTLIKALRLAPGIEIEDLCDVMEADTTVDVGNKRIDMVTSEIKNISNSKTVWELEVSKIL